MLDDLFTCIAFFTILPVPHKEIQADFLSKTTVWVPVVGLLIGVIISSLHLLIISITPSLLTGGLVLLVWVVVSGGLHLDGLADCFDAFCSATTVEKRQQIMKDPHLGSFGVIAICIVLILKFTFIQSQVLVPVQILSYNFLGSIGLFIAPILARWSVLWMGVFHPFSQEGLGYHFSHGITNQKLALASIIPLAMMILFGVKAIIAVISSIFLAWFLGKIAVRKIHTITGDVMGMVIETVELMCLFLFAFKL